MLAVPNVSGATGVAMAVAEGVLSPIALVATTVTLYSIRLVRPVMMQEVAVALVAVQVKILVLSCAVAVYVVMALPPVSIPDNAVQLTVISPFPATADTPVGARGTVASTLTIKVSAAVAGGVFSSVTV